MMAAAQPFLCGSISKTVNMPNMATVDEIEKLYIDAWKMGLKCVAVYRDNSKLAQALSTIGSEHDPEPPVTVIRKRLPKKRLGFTQEATIGGHKVYLRTGEYEDGTLGELFIDMHKEGATLRSLLNTIAIAVSLGLQHGVPLAEYVDAFTWTRFQPSGPVTGHANIKMATSLIDYLFKALGVEYLGRVDLAHVHPLKDASGEVSADPAPNGLKPVNGAVKASNDAQTCSTCGGLTRRTGTCATCTVCGTTSGCG
ncbi:MAG TPA: vitamin B12-dependent ribonucleotide reductase, partial [Thermoleophilia bacterium]|nr:vitamin B12-dependent ribonucleotide reductase [Thermoleophilia bacterium]